MLWLAKVMTKLWPLRCLTSLPFPSFAKAVLFKSSHEFRVCTISFAVWDWWKLQITIPRISEAVWARKPTNVFVPWSQVQPNHHIWSSSGISRRWWGRWRWRWKWRQREPRVHQTHKCFHVCLSCRNFVPIELPGHSPYELSLGILSPFCTHTKNYSHSKIVASLSKKHAVERQLTSISVTKCPHSFLFNFRDWVIQLISWIVLSNVWTTGLRLTDVTKCPSNSDSLENISNANASLGFW